MTHLFASAMTSAFVAALVTHLLVPLLAKMAPSVGAMDYPGERRDHRHPVPRIGGLAMVVGFLSGAGFVVLAGWYELFLEVRRHEIMSIGIAVFLVFLVGLVDDLIGVSVSQKFIFQFVAAWLVVQAGWVFEVVRLPYLGTIDVAPFHGLVTILWIVGVTNAINFVDGLDGLAGGVVAIISCSFLIYALMQGRILTVVWVSAIVGACVGFLRHNWEPARVYMGDSGSLTLGFLLATISVHSALKAPVAVAILVPILALGLPVIDTLLVMRVRFFNMQGSGFLERIGRMFRADQQHLHHLLLRFGLRRRRIVAVIYGLVLLFSASSLLVASQRNPDLGMLLIIVEILVVVFLRHWGLGRIREQPSYDDLSRSRDEAS